MWSDVLLCVYSLSDHLKRFSGRSASSGSVLDMAPGLSQRLTQAADPTLFRVPSESAVQHEAPPPPAPPLPAANTGGLAEALKSAQLRKTPKVCLQYVYQTESRLQEEISTSEYTHSADSKSNKKFELMLTRRAKAYSSSGSHKVNIQIPNSLSGLHNDNSVAPPCEWYRLVLQPKIAKNQ